MEKIDLRAIAKETVEVSKLGKYNIGSRFTIPFDTTNHTKLYKVEDFVTLEDRIFTSPFVNENPIIEVRNEGTVNAIFRLANGKGKSYLPLGVLNFASAHSPGGGFLTGALAQEECLAFCSDLYMKQIGEVGEQYYKINEDRNSAFYTDTMFISNVTFFRDSSYNFVMNPVMCSVVTSPAVNMRLVAQRKASFDEAQEVMKDRMRKILQVFIDNSCTEIILGAFGCGVFGNDAEDVARYWKELLVDENLKVYFNRIVFSILDRPTGKSNLEPFKQFFS